jgi:hypothetical protein
MKCYVINWERPVGMSSVIRLFKPEPLTDTEHWHEILEFDSIDEAVIEIIKYGEPNPQITVNTRQDKPRKVCKEKVDGNCPHHNLHCAYPKCEEE